MSTRSNTVVYEDDEIILNMYRQCDGYLEGHGKELAEFLAPIRLINGIGLDSDNTDKANGMGCLAAQIVAHFKKKAGGFYIVPPTSLCDNDYTYEIRNFPDTDSINLKVYEYSIELFSIDISGPDGLANFDLFSKQAEDAQ
jgi:hypothetical protein